jgi:hypothetical protein
MQTAVVVFVEEIFPGVCNSLGKRLNMVLQLICLGDRFTNHPALKKG